MSKVGDVCYQQNHDENDELTQSYYMVLYIRIQLARLLDATEYLNILPVMLLHANTQTQSTKLSCS